MGIIKNIQRVSAIALLVAGTVSGAQAALVSGVATGTGDVVFDQSSTASMVVTPKTGLPAGVTTAGTEIATAVASILTGGSAATYVAYRWTPTASVMVGTDALTRTISGKANLSNKLEVTSTAPATLDSAGLGWYVANAANIPLNISVKTTTQQTVAADTFTVSLDAAVWVA
ncbi:hypothetical protein [Rahnella sp. PAMC 25559]|uniref:hypothetical protein n=1 Tax=Rahnella sp. PAMC 25559 TaxID=3423225 RepID=UPI003D673482